MESTEIQGSGPRRSLSFQLAVALTLALLPIGVLAAVLAADGIRSTREAELVRAEDQFRTTARVVDDLLSVDFLVLRALLRNESGLQDGRTCNTEAANALDDAETFDALVWADMLGRPVCESRGGTKPSTAELTRLAAEGERENLIWPGGDHVFFAVREAASRGQPGLIVATASISRLQARLREIAAMEGDVTVWLGDKAIVGDPPPGISAPGGLLTVRRVSEPGQSDNVVASGPLSIAPFALTTVVPGARLAFADILAIAAPSLMWIAALLIGWMVVQRFVVRPLQNMASGVRAYGAGNDHVRLSGAAGQTDEMQAFAETFDAMAKNMADARQDVDTALTEQRRLTREVHHRVKNNLQIITSLISIQAREAEGGDVSRAYASIQMRVGALSIVHRWLYEESAAHGVDFTALTQDLCASLQQTIPTAKLVEPRINTHLERLHISQDAAVPLAFLITEVIAFAARLAAAEGDTRLTIDIHVKRTETGGELQICSDAFGEKDALAPTETRAAARIVSGMVRQLRGRLVFDSGVPCYTVEFPLKQRPDKILSDAGTKPAIGS
ncbi:sensor histidine kinase [Sphingosinicella soli]|uniref:histidine kinase n=1 Tax=Sphingosinicella soli TaxID=333708 RepID=A0A7W7B2H6_9SPHN|nr:histidine kinase dimerization/phosphoacceptor domain -containing protein [Sphingosinicella soli]MBB4631845.1 two-component sensor histidine kinase [Sphingosinicella soli]